MTISAAQFQTWLEAPHARRCALFELTFLGAGVGSPVIGTEYQAFVSNMPYVTAGDQTPANQIFDDCVLEIPSFTRRMNEQLTGRSTQNYGDLIIANPSGDRDDWYSMNWDGRRVRQWLGDPSWPFADFRLVLDGIIIDVFDPGGGKVGFKIGDKGALLDRPLMTDTLGGDGPNPGDVMPLCYGLYNVNITPKVVDVVDHIYRFTQTDTGGLVEAPYRSNLLPENPYDVREDGVSLKSSGNVTASDAAADTITKVGHGWTLGTRLCFRPYGGSGQEPPTPLAYSTTAIDQTYYWVAEIVDADNVKLASTFALGLAGTPDINITQTLSGKTIPYVALNWTPAGDGTFQLASNPAGLITCDCYGLGTNMGSPPIATYITLAGEIIEQALTSGITNTPFTSADIDAASLANFVAVATRKVGIYITERMTFAELMDKMVLSVGGWWGFSRSGLLQFGRLDLPVGGSPIYSFTADDIAQRSLKMTKRILPRAEVKVVGATNWTVQQSVAGSVDEFDRAFYMAPNLQKTGVATVTTWDTDPTNHRSATRPEPFQTYLYSADIQGEATRLATLFQRPTAIFAFQTHQAVYLLQLGDEIYVEHAKFTGYGIVVGIVERVKGRSDIEFFCQLPDVYPTEDLS